MAGHITRDLNKTSQIAEQLRQQILQGDLASGERLQSMRELGLRFEASQSILTNVFDLLEQEGLLVRKPRSGVFVASRLPEAPRMNNKVFFCMPSQGHFFKNLFMQLFQRMNEHGFVPLAVDSTQLICEQPRAEMVEHAHEILRSSPAAAVVYGGGYWQHPILERYPHLKRIFLLELDHPQQAGDQAILVDYEKAMYRLTCHLIEQGCRRVAMVHAPVPGHEDGAALRQLHHYDLLFSGYERALRRHGLSGYRRYLPVADEQITPSWLRSMLGASDRPDGLVCEIDHTARCVGLVARKLGIRVPEALKLTGFFNTPWSRSVALPLTSARVDIRGMADHLIAMLTGAAVPPVAYVHAAVIARQSSGAGGETTWVRTSPVMPAAD